MHPWIDAHARTPGAHRQRSSDRRAPSQVLTFSVVHSSSHVADAYVPLVVLLAATVRRSSIAAMICSRASFVQSTPRRDMLSCTKATSRILASAACVAATRPTLAEHATRLRGQRWLLR